MHGQMKRALNALLLAPTLSIALGSAAFAQQARDGGFRQRDVVGGAKWYVHVDLRELKGSRVGKELLSKIDGDAKRKIKAFERMISFNPLEDLDSVTISGVAAEPERAVVSLRGVFDIPHLTDLARAADGHAEVIHGGRTIHSWDDDKSPGQRINACLLSENAMLFGPDLALVRAGIDTLQAKLEGPNGGAVELPFPPVTGRRPPFASAWADFSVLDGLEIESDFVRRVQASHLSVGEDGGKAFARIVVDAVDARAPKLMGRIVSGTLALGEAVGELPTEIVESVSVQTEDKRLVIDGAMALDSLVELVENIEKLKGRL